MSEPKKRVCIIGGGLVGSICACFFAKRNDCEVELFEMRSDFRGDATARGRSINMALSHRGLEALARVGLKEKVTKNGIPMHARMIHDLNGTTRPIPYGQPGQFIMSIDRMHLNEILLTAAIDEFSVKVFFGHKLRFCDPETGSVEFSKQETGETVTRSFDLVVGCDGAFSAVRRSIFRHRRFDFEQKYIEHGYMEVEFPPAAPGKHSMATNFLHIWPRNEFMLIALPNLDGSFTGTAFMPFGMFEQLNSEQQVRRFFRETFPDAVPLIGEKNLIDTVLRLKPQPLLYVRCRPYHAADKAMIVGDAAHAMVPFYGQGMNCGFEDCIILDDLMQLHGTDFAKILPAFTDARVEDAHAIVDLALDNYVEMRKSVNSVWFLLRKRLDNALHRLFPSRWVPLYTMVTFTRTRYSSAVHSRRRQDLLLTRLLFACGAGTCAAAAAVCYRNGCLRAAAAACHQLSHCIADCSLRLPRVL